MQQPPPDESPPWHWRIAGATVRGALHRRRDLPNQDALGFWPVTGGHAAVLAVADGHGSSKCYRSAEGARLAVQVALDLIRGQVLGRAGGTAAEWQALAKELPRQLVAGWQAAVRQSLEDNALPDEEEDFSAYFQSLIDAEENTEADPYLPFGTTLLAVAVTPGALLYWQLGDGDILMVVEDGAVTRPLSRDERLIANETTSLCSAGAIDDFRVCVQPLEDRPPALVLVSTDGYANSFRDDAGFLQVGSDLLAMIRADGLEAVAGALEGWLTEASEQGSGDDVTLGLLYRTEGK
jgi:serine/threonine protein phosphatase PrpC